jgi:hypothetical protein
MDPEHEPLKKLNGETQESPSPGPGRLTAHLSAEEASKWEDILGAGEGVEIGFRQARRTEPIATVSISTPQGEVVIPTLAEMIAMKAFLAYSRNVVRDYLDFAALTTCTDEAHGLEALGNLDRLYGHLQSSSVALEVAKTLSKPEPTDLQGADLSQYRALAPQWHDWRRTEHICQHFGVLLASVL